MTAEIICVGNELLYGDVLNTNTKYLSQQLAMIGIDVTYQLVVGDDEPKLLEAIHQAGQRVDVVIFSGGLGPTYDDMTKETLTKAIGDDLVLDHASLEAIKGFFSRIGREMKDSNNKQAYRPSSGLCLPNNNGTAPGVYVEKEGVHYFCLPGPPRELMPMYLEGIKPRLAQLTGQVISSKTFSLAGIGESDLAVKIGHIMDHSDNPRIAPYVKTGMVNIRLTAVSETADEGQRMIEEATDRLMPFIEPYVYSDQGQSIEEVLVEALQESNGTIGTAESCTGGMMSARIVNVSGASEVFMSGFTTYSNEAKMKWLNVPEESLKTFGAVSEEVALSMADGVRQVSESTIGVGITGIAGPGGGTPDKPVGTVCIAASWKHGNSVRRYQFSGNRTKIREISAQYALVQAYRLLQEMKNNS